MLMCKLSFEVSAPFTYTSQAQYGHAEVANPMSHWPSSALHCILLDVSYRYNVCVVCIIFFWVQEQAHADNWGLYKLVVGGGPPCKLPIGNGKCKGSNNNPLL